MNTHKQETSEMRTLEGDVLDIVEQHVGSGNAITVAEIMRELSLPGDSVTVRTAIKRLITEGGHPIGAHPNSGVFIVDTPEDLDLVCSNLYSRISGIVDRISCLRKNFHNAS